MFLTDPIRVRTALSNEMIREWKLGCVTANMEMIYSPYPVSSRSRCGKANAVALTVLFHAMDHSPPFLTILVGSTAPKESSRSPNFSILRSSFVVESCPLRTASKLTALPDTTFFHSESGNSGQSDWLVSERLVALGSTVYAS